MREILFRGKRIDSGEWVFGMPWIFKEKSCICPWKKGMCKYDTGFFPVEVIPETVGQYIGLKDKNGKRIFEGDIVKHYNKTDDDTAYDKGLIFFDSKVARYKRTQSLGECYLGDHCCYEVVGNVYDNPELLEVNDEWS